MITHQVYDRINCCLTPIIIWHYTKKKCLVVTDREVSRHSEGLKDGTVFSFWLKKFKNIAVYNP